jgi:putative transposase
MNKSVSNSSHNRRSIRLSGYDYSQPGEYFITICTYERVPLFGEISAAEMHLNELGQIVDDEWRRTPQLRQEIELGAYVIMPNHLHAIVHILENANSCRGTACTSIFGARRAPTDERFGKPVAGSLPTIVRSFKSAVTKRINETRDIPYLPVWQRNYYEHVINVEKEYLLIEKPTLRRGVH